MSKASHGASLELVRRVTDVEWRVGVDAALLHDHLYTGSQFSVPITASELAVHRRALRHVVEHRDVSSDGLTVLTAIQLRLEIAFDDLDESDGPAPRTTVDLDGTEILALATAHFGAADHAGSAPEVEDATLHRLLGRRLLDRIEDVTPPAAVLPHGR
ncbi:MAG TPA: hypothetical protein VJ898_01555 [Natrialbaceae archaeon]|nr:hypothetical protein [Natrialbaceae archaeon]